MRIQAPRGTKDILPNESHRWIRLENTFRELTNLYGYREIRTPTFEDTALFARTAGETSDIVTKQMYTFMDKGGRSITLKPEGTAPVLRAVIEHQLLPQGSVARLSYIIPFFRYERPQLGRLREPHQAGIELIGSTSPAADAEVIEIAVRFYERIGLTGIAVNINSLGRDECRGKYRDALLNYAERYLKDQEMEVRDRVLKNPLRLLDFKDPEAIEAMKGAPSILDFLEPDSQARFEKLQELLKLADVDFRVAPEIVRGLDYYTETVFEVLSTKLGAQGALCGGGRYDNLMSDLGGPSTPSVGVGIGLERALIVLEQEMEADLPLGPDIFLVQASDAAAEPLTRIAIDLRKQNISVLRDLDGKNMKSQMKMADRASAKRVLILGEDELAKGVAILRELATGEQVEVPLENIGEILRQSSGS